MVETTVQTKLTPDLLRKELTDGNAINTIMECFKQGETVELKREKGNLVVIGIKRKLKHICILQK